MVRYSGPVGTNPNLTLTSVGQNDNGNKYRAIYTNLCGSVTSTVTLLNVGAPINCWYYPECKRKPDAITLDLLHSQLMQMAVMD
jgi:hypothetical protein